MRIGLIDVDGHNFPNIPLMKISAWHKRQGDHVEWYSQMFSGKMDRVYMSKIFSFTPDYDGCIEAEEIIKGGSGYCIEKSGNKEIYNSWKDQQLPCEIEHIYPDYEIYSKLTRDKAYGFLSRGCPRGCPFCHVGAKEGKRSYKTANLSEFWKGQENICLCDPNILACKESEDLLGQLIDSRAIVDFNQGIDVRLATPEKIEMLNKIRIKTIYLAWDQPKQDLKEDFRRFSECYKRKSDHGKVVYVLVNFNSTLEEDLYRIYTLRELQYDPYVMIYDKQNADKERKRLARWVNSRQIWRSCRRFEDYTA